MRLFVAIRPPEPVRERLLDAMEGLEGARWQDEENLHVTLRFVGEVEPQVAEDLAGELARIRMGRFALTLAGVGHFESKGRPHAAWARVEPSAELLELRGKVEAACRAAGLEPETRRYVPHVTLARLGRGSGPLAPWLAEHGTLRAGPWEVERFWLFESHLAPGGATYEPVLAFPLG